MPFCVNLIESNAKVTVTGGVGNYSAERSFKLSVLLLELSKRFL